MSRFKHQSRAFAASMKPRATAPEREERVRPLKTASLMTLAAMAAILACQPTWAGFIDERTKKPAAEADQASKAPLESTRVGALTIQSVSVGWEQSAPVTTHPVGLGAAVAQLLPQGHPPVKIQADGDVVDLRVSWPAGLNRRQALEHIARTAGLDLKLESGVMRAEVVPAKTVAAAGAKAVPAATAASAALASAAPAAVVDLPPAVVYAATPADGNIRRLLRRWSAQAGWTFGDEHWTLAADIPLVASLTLGGDFKQAVRTVLDATEFTAAPGRPCFYSNNVLRIVPRHEQCNRGGS